ncbi:MAG: FtsX-like permease family protein [Pseudobdellovibrio sp.]
MLLWRLAFRNLLRHRGRLFLNMLLLVGAFSTIVCFKGFKNHVLNEIQRIMIDTQFGHIQVAKKKYWDNSAVDQLTDKMIQNTSELVTQISENPQIQFVSPRIEFYGLVNTEEKSVTAHFVGIQPNVETQLQSSLLIPEGTAFHNAHEALLSTGLKTKLNLKSGSSVTVVSPTLAGGVNAMDLHVQGIFGTGIAEVDNGTIYLPLVDAQKILDTDFADKLVITIKNESNSAEVISDIRRIIKNTDLEVKSWRDLADLYNQVEDFYIFQNFFIEMIILLLLLLSVANTVSMTVFERLSEIGTLRALGDYETDIQKLFLIESFLLGGLSILIGIPISLAIVHFVSSLSIPITLPMASQPILFKLLPNVASFIEASTVCLFSVVLASLWPARKGSKIPIVSALLAKI